MQSQAEVFHRQRGNAQDLYMCTMEDSGRQELGREVFRVGLRAHFPEVR